MLIPCICMNDIFRRTCKRHGVKMLLSDLNFLVYFANAEFRAGGVPGWLKFVWCPDNADRLPDGVRHKILETSVAQSCS